MPLLDPGFLLVDLEHVDRLLFGARRQREDPIYGRRSRNVCCVGGHMQTRFDDAAEGGIRRGLAAGYGLERLDCIPLDHCTIDAEHGLFVTVVPKTGCEGDAFAEVLLAGDVRWEEILRKQHHRLRPNAPKLAAVLTPVKARPESLGARGDVAATAV